MKKFLYISCFLFLQIISCSTGTIEAKPEATKFLIQNNFKLKLQEVTWDRTNFGDIGWKEYSEMIVSNDGKGPILFSINGKKYRTQDYILGKKHEINRFTFNENTLVIDLDTNILGPLGGMNVD